MDGDEQPGDRKQDQKQQRGEEACFSDLKLGDAWGKSITKVCCRA